ncbi:MAG: response regulator transcription factor [Peptostreptococcaceae bacterium]|nr:response regulator transcription factor [Peptostreptococcaceae bacterium]
MKQTILVIEDEDNIRKIIADYFKAKDFDVIEAVDGKDGITKFEKEEVDLVILDIMMPLLDGWSVCRRIRKKSNTPIIMLTARTEEDDELMGFELKADDYIKKPFSPAILVARAKALLERNKIKEVDNLELKKPENKEVIIKEDIKLDISARELYVDNIRIELAPKEFDMLSYLMQNEGIVLSRDKILEHVWGYDFYGYTRTVDNHVKKLRKALGDKSFYIRTVFGVGYKFEVTK